MARMRTLKPEFWTDDVIVELSPWARLLYMGCWNFALCDQGHLDDSPKSLKLKILPADPVDPVELVEELIKLGRLVRKETPDGRTYLHARTLSKHSKTDTRWNSRCEYCAIEGAAKPASSQPSSENLTETQESLTEPADTQEKSSSKGKEGKVKESKESGARERGTRIPDDFEVTPEMRAWAREKAPGVNIQLETIKFVNHFKAKTGKGSTMLRWDLAWQNWMLRSVEFGGARASPQQPQLVEPAYFRPLGGDP